MRLDIPYDDDSRVLRRERQRRPDAESSREPKPLVDPGPLDRRIEQLTERAQQNLFPEIPRREYERKISPDDPKREAGERHVRSRRHLPCDLAGVRLRPEEKQVIAEAGRFRVVTVKDLAQTIYSGDERALRADLRYLEQKGLATLDRVNARRDGRRREVERIDVVTLTADGERLARRDSQFVSDQKLYHGLVKPREVEHDSQIYRAYLKEWERIEREGGRNPRVLLDFELKAQVQKAIYAERKADSEREIDSIKQAVAEQHQLPFIEGQIQIPDARIEYELDQGGRTGSSDIEVVTAAYHPGHLRSKVQAGFHLYVSGRDAATLSARIEGEHHLLDHVLDL